MGEAEDRFGGESRPLRSLRSVAVRGKRVLVRIDANVSVDDDGRPVPGGELRLRAIIPTLLLLRSQGARTILLSHLGRPGGAPVEALRLDDVARRLAVLLGFPVRYVPDLCGERARAAVASLRDGETILLENLRFESGEERNDPRFARVLSSLGDLFVAEAFSVAHRQHASVALLPRLLPSYAGLRLASEVASLAHVLENPARPLVAVVSGAKVETKLELLRRLLRVSDRVLVGGGVGNTLLRLAGFSIGVSLAARDVPADLGNLLRAAADRLYLPTDVRVARAGDIAHPLLLPVSAIEPMDDILDLGPESSRAYCRALADARTCVWNGPLGRFEAGEAYTEGTRAVVHCVPDAAFSVVGGGETLRLLERLGALQRFDLVSTGGGAMLAFLEGAPMPGLEPLLEKSAGGVVG